MYRISELVQLERRLYHTADLGLVWGVANKNTLYTTIKRYVKKGILFPLYKGLYSTVPISQLDPFELGPAIVHRYTYLSCETVLVASGAISHAVFPYTFVSDISKRITIGAHDFLFRRAKSDILHNPTGITQVHGTFRATPERAMADLLHFNPKFHFDVLDNTNLTQVAQIQKALNYL